MIGAIAGDIIGSVYEHRPIKTKDFPLFHPRCRFTDDTMLTVAVADAISLGGDSDTLACITGGIAEAFYGGVPEEIRAKVQECLTPDLWEVTEAFCRKYGLSTLAPGTGP